MNSRPFAPTAAVVLCLLQVVTPGWRTSLASTSTQALDPPYLSEMPSVDKVMQAMKTADPGETAGSMRNLRLSLRLTFGR